MATENQPEEDLICEEYTVHDIRTSPDESTISEEYLSLVKQIEIIYDSKLLSLKEVAEIHQIDQEKAQEIISNKDNILSQYKQYILCNYETINYCLLCNANYVDEFSLGAKFKDYGICVHQYCVIFAQHLRNQLNDLSTEKIIDEIIENCYESCSYCLKRGATVKCCYANCNVQFHLPCGIANQSLNQFYDSFQSFCVLHRPQQDIDEKWTISNSSMMCYLCFARIKYGYYFTYIVSPCCRKWFHTTCIQKYATKKESNLHCPSCSNVKEFSQEIIKFGIRVKNNDQDICPSKDISDESIGNSFFIQLYEETYEIPVNVWASLSMVAFKEDGSDGYLTLLQEEFSSGDQPLVKAGRNLSNDSDKNAIVAGDDANGVKSNDIEVTITVSNMHNYSVNDEWKKALPPLEKPLILAKYNKMSSKIKRRLCQPMILHWIVYCLDNKCYEGLSWNPTIRGLFVVPWPRASGVQKFKPGGLFYDYAVMKGDRRIVNVDQIQHAKRNFRCSLNKLQQAGKIRLVTAYHQSRIFHLTNVDDVRLEMSLRSYDYSSVISASEIFQKNNEMKEKTEPVETGDEKPIEAELLVLPENEPENVPTSETSLNDQMDAITEKVAALHAIYPDNVQTSLIEKQALPISEYAQSVNLM